MPLPSDLTSGSQAHFSVCRQYRYVLVRMWEELFSNPKMMMVIGVNPSRADEHDNDLTTTKCIGLAKRAGMGGIILVNLFAWVNTKPEEMKLVPSPVGPDNDLWLSKAASVASVIVAAWGADGAHLGRAAQVAALPSLAGRLHCWGKTVHGNHPRHPSRLPYASALEPYV